MSGWYARAVLHVADVERAVGFYVGKLGFSEAWRHAEEDRLLVGIASARGGFPFTGGGMAIAAAAHIGGFIIGVLLANPLLLFRYREA